MLNTRKMEQALQEMDPVKKAYIRRYWLPARLKVTLVEKQPLFVVYENQESMPKYAISTEATRIGKAYLPLPDNYQQLTYKVILPGPESQWSKEILTTYETILRLAEKPRVKRLNILI